MSLFKNNIMSLVTNPSFLGPEINNSDYVSVACVSGSDSYMNHPNVHDCSILLPPTDMMMAWVDGKIILQNEYPKYLLSKDPDDMIIALLKGIQTLYDYIIIPDVRFPNEVDKMCDNFDCITIRIIRPNFDNGLTDEQKNHPSETALDDYPMEYELINYGDFKNLLETIKTFLKNIG